MFYDSLIYEVNFSMSQQKQFAKLLQLLPFSSNYPLPKNHFMQMQQKLHFSLFCKKSWNEIETLKCCKKHLWQFSALAVVLIGLKQKSVLGLNYKCVVTGTVAVILTMIFRTLSNPTNLVRPNYYCKFTGH